jgi:hypothetical protein
MATGAFGVDVLDQSLRVLQSVFAARGLTPYADYGFLYPPGFAWFYGKLLGLQQPESVIAANAVVDLLLALTCAIQVMRLAASHRWLFGGAVLLLLGGAMPVVMELYAGPNSPVLLLIALLLLVEVMTRGPSAARVVALVGVAAVGTLIRWDFTLFAAVLEVGGAAVVWLAAGTIPLGSEQSTQVRRMALHLWWAALALLAGVTLALSVVAGFALATGTWAQTRLFVFDLPLRILPFRRLPLPTSIHLRRDMQWLLDIVAMALIAVAGLLAWVETRARSGLIYLLEGVALLAPCAALLPYTFTRADFFHVLPLTVLVTMMSLVALILWTSRAARWPLLLALALAAMPSLRIAVRYVASTRGTLQADIQLRHSHELTVGCTELFPPDARSLFIGQVSYKRFIANMPIFYLMRPDLRPATPFISDEPGVQNSCDLGSEIAADLIRATRPLVLVLDTEPWDAEPNLTLTMTSCGKIEDAMATMPALVLGTCHVIGRTFRVEVVR